MVAAALQGQAATVMVQDSFTRTVSNGWGTADVGGSYALPSSNSSNYSTNGSVGYFTINSANTNRELALTGAGSQTARDVESSARLGTLKMPVGTGAEIRFATLARQVSSTTMYRGVLRLLANGSVKLQVQKLVNGNETWISSSATVPGLTVAVYDYMRLRMQVSGANPTTIKLRAWKDGTTEPTTWLVTQTDSEPALQQAGAVGLRTHLTSEVTNPPITVRWDDWLVTTLAGSMPPAPSYDDSYSYDTIGNLTGKDGVIQQYGANGDGTGAGPHQARTVGGAAYSYDANGNLLSGGGRMLTWNAENQPTQIVSGGITEQYSYDADGARVTRSATPGLSTRYAFGLYEVEGAITRSYYMLAGQVVAVRDSGLGLSYLYGDHLSSISASTSATGQVQGVQHYDAWGKRLTGSVPQTKRSYTGQYLDDTGLLFYNARYYDAGIGRFVSADTIAPGKKDPQNRNRYSYTLNNPLIYTDPTGHCASGDGDDPKACQEKSNYLSSIGVDVSHLSDWMLAELVQVIEGLNRLMAVAQWSVADFKNAMTNGGQYHIALERVPALDRYGDVYGMTEMVGNNITIYMANAAFRDNRRAQITTVHEFAHVMDFASSIPGTPGVLSNNMAAATGSYIGCVNYLDCILNGGPHYIPGGTPASDYARQDRFEDFAEAVAATIFPDDPRYTEGGKLRMDATRHQYIQQVFAAMRRSQ